MKLQTVWAALAWITVRQSLWPHVPNKAQTIEAKKSQNCAMVLFQPFVTVRTHSNS
ncbi:MAG: hypothetical protein AAFO68_04795 [Pseudomonadota bacterium]